MFNKPDSGWIEFKFKDENDKDVEIHVSYITAAMFKKWLESMAHGLQHNLPITLYGDCEGTEIYINTYYDCTYVIIDGDELELFKLECNWFKFIEEFISDCKTFMTDIFDEFEENFMISKPSKGSYLYELRKKDYCDDFEKKIKRVEKWLNIRKKKK